MRNEAPPIANPNILFMRKFIRIFELNKLAYLQGIWRPRKCLKIKRNFCSIPCPKGEMRITKKLGYVKRWGYEGRVGYVIR